MTPDDAREICYFSRFPPSGQGGGGTHRVMQLLELLGEAQTQLVCSARRDWLPPVPGPGEQGAAPRWRDVARLMGREWLMWSRARRSVVLRLRGISRVWAGSVGDPAGIRLAVMDDPIYFRPLARRLAVLRIPRVAVCHNLESRSAEQVVPFWSSSLLRREIGDLARCDLVITISPEDQAQLQQGGVRTVQLDYYPPAPVRRRLVKIRRRREDGEPRRGLLALGSARNADTLAGLRRVVDAWPELAPVCGPLRVAGFGTERLRGSGPPSGDVHILGTLSDGDLDDAVTGADACLCYQESGGGVLTRIPEMLTAGVPVLANRHAARSFRGRPGIVEFTDLHELPAIVPRLSELAALVPPPSPPSTGKLSDEFAALVR